MVTANRKRGSAMPTVSVDHTSEGKRYLEKGLELVKSGDINNATEVFFHAAVEFEKAQEYRQVSALWEAIGKLSELEEGSIPPITEEWPLNYHVIKTDGWHEQKDEMHKLAWAYQWAAEHRGRVIGEGYRAYPLFLKSVEKAEQTEYSKNDPSWPAELYRNAALNFIRTYGSIEHAPDVRRVKKEVSNKELIKEGIKKMEAHLLRIKDRSKAYSTLATSYRLLKSDLIEAGNLAEAEPFKRKERSALMHYYFHRKSYFRAVTECLSGSGFMYFIIGLFLMILFVFPYIYYQWNLIVPVQGKITYLDIILYSIESALGIGYDKFYAIGYGRLLNIFEAALSWLGLGVFIWWLTRRLE